MLIVITDPESPLFSSPTLKFRLGCNCPAREDLLWRDPSSSKLGAVIGSIQLSPKYWDPQALGPTFYRNMRNHRCVLFCVFVFKSNLTPTKVNDLEVSFSGILPESCLVIAGMRCRNPEVSLT